MNKDQFYDASGEVDDDVIEVDVLVLLVQDGASQKPVQELVEQVSTVAEGVELAQ